MQRLTYGISLDNYTSTAAVSRSQTLTRKAGESQSRAQTPFGKIEKGSGNTAIQCLFPKEFNQSRNHTLMFTYAVKIEGVRRCMACMIGKYGRTEISVKIEFKPRVTLGGTLNEQNLE